MRKALLVALALVTMACTEAPGTREQPPGVSPQPRTDTPDAGTEPLVVVVHATHRTPRITERTARLVASGALRTWQRLDGSARPLRIVDGPDAVERDLDAAAVVPASRVTPGVRAAVVAGVDPLLRPTAYPLQVAGPPPPRPLTVTVVGDIMLGRRVGTRTDADPQPLQPLRRRLAAADLTLGNLESTLSTAGSPQQGDDSFAAPPAVLRGLAAAGFDALSLANNHTGDFGVDALVETVSAFRRSSVRSFGAGSTLREAGRPFVRTVRGVRFGVLGFNAIGETPRATRTTPGALSLRMPPRTGPLNRSDLAHLTRLVRRLDRQVDVVVVLPHWGTQYTHVAEPAQRVVARRLVDAGADLVVGGHAHWVQGMERYRGAVVAHSLGNFVFDMDFMAETQQGVMLEATFWGSSLKRVDLVPYLIGADFAPRPASARQGAAILDDVWRHSSGPFRARGARPRRAGRRARAGRG